MQQVQDLLNFKIDTPDNEELRRRFADEADGRLRSLSEHVQADPVDFQQTMQRLKSRDLSNVYRQQGKEKARRRTARKARKVARRKARA
ncbi:MAG: hypothetical protein Hals2KO_21840 [Halioglobus sp.]